MKLDDTFEAVNRIWQEISVIVVLHAVAFGLAFYAEAISMPALSQGGVSSASLWLTDLSTFLQSLGLDLPLVVGVALVVYVVLFQHLSAAAIQLPPFRLAYSQASLWRAGKCFDELRQLVPWFEGYTASADLADLEVTLGLAVAQYAKDYPEHHRQLVDARLAAAAMWSRYYSGFCLLAFAAVVGLVVFRLPASVWLVPVGLFAAACAARCAWEAQIERAVLGRLRFAIDCACINGVQKRHAASDDAPASIWDNDATSPIPVFARIQAERDQFARLRNDRHGFAGELPYTQAARRLAKRRAEDLRRLERELALCADLVKLPPPCFPYQHGWLLHFVRRLRPFAGLGALPVRRNEWFRSWLWWQLQLTVRNDPNLFEPPHAEDREYSISSPSASHRDDDDMLLAQPSEAERETSERVPPWDILRGGYERGAAPYNRLWQRIVDPEPVQDGRLVARLLRTRAWGHVGRWLAPRTLLVDAPSRYWNGRHGTPRADPQLEPFRRWVSRRRR